MKTFWRFAVEIVLLNLALGGVFGVFAQEGTITGAYGETSAADPDVITAARFAVRSASRKNGVALSLVSVQRAELQVVSGLNYRLELKVTSNGKTQEAKAVVYRDLRNKYLLSSWDVVGPTSSAGPYSITSVKAMLFYDGKGTFSRDVLAKPDFTFWNTIIGEGDAEGPSNSTLVLIEVTGNPSRDEAAPSRSVEFSATASRRVLIKKITGIGLFGDDGKYYSAFWLYNTGCDPVKITARIIGQAKASSISKTIPFNCGE